MDLFQIIYNLKLTESYSLLILVNLRQKDSMHGKIFKEYFNTISQKLFLKELTYTPEKDVFPELDFRPGHSFFWRLSDLQWMERKWWLKPKLKVP